MNIPKVLVLSSGTKNGGGSGFKNLVEQMNRGVLQAVIVSVVCNHLNGGVHQKANALKIPFRHFAGPWTAEAYQNLLEETHPDYVVLSGWLKPALGLDSRKTLNIHPCVLPEFGGKGMYGHHAHEAILESARNGGGWTFTEVCMHFVTTEYDKGPVIFRHKVPILPEDTADTLAARVNKVEHEFQPIITNMVVNEFISWDGIEGHEPKFPSGYVAHRRADLKAPHEAC